MRPAALPVGRDEPEPALLPHQPAQALESIRYGDRPADEPHLICRGGVAALMAWGAGAGGADAGGMRRRARRRVSDWRQTAESIYAVLVDMLHRHFPLTKTLLVVVRRIAAKAAACIFGIWPNRQLGRKALALESLFPG